MQQFRHYESNIEIFKLKPTEDAKEFGELVAFVSQVSLCYPKVVTAFPGQIRELLCVTTAYIYMPHHPYRRPLPSTHVALRPGAHHVQYDVAFGVGSGGGGGWSVVADVCNLRSLLTRDVSRSAPTRGPHTTTRTTHHPPLTTTTHYPPPPTTTPLHHHHHQRRRDSAAAVYIR